MPRAVHEEPLAALAAAHLAGQGWSLFSEVAVEDGICDLVARRDDSGICLIGECKAKRIGWQVVKQAARRRPYANYVCVFTPTYQDPEDEALGIEIVRALRIGWTIVGSSGSVKELVPAPPLRAEPGDIGQVLRDEHRWWAAPGNARGQRFSPHAKTVRDLVAYVREHPRCSLEDAVAAGVTHFRNAQEARRLVPLIRKGKLGPLRVKHDGVRFRLHLDDAADAWPAAAHDGGLHA